MIEQHDPPFDEAVVQQIMMAAKGRRIKTVGEFSHFTRGYLAAGYPREVSEAHRRYFDNGSRRPLAAEVVTASR
jgi:hypothetical protein